jgi:RNA polymerase sigma-70 factor (ECF subfamily)
MSPASLPSSRPPRLESPPPAPLLTRCRAGDQLAWRRLIGDRAAQVFRWAVLLGLGPSEAEDAGQEVFAIAHRRIDSCRADEALTAWLFQITRRVCANHRRRGWWRRWLRLDSAAPGESAPAFEPVVAPTGTDELAVRACLRRLPPRLAEALILMDVDGLSREEAAAALGVPAGTVASRLRRGRQAFERLWNDEGGGEPDIGADGGHD